ncbi:MAG TPA: hypothetical protein VKZ18_02230 [Polyangia bacterium]|nr:hypothetical protein [Polyangia bacterium]
MADKSKRKPARPAKKTWQKPRMKSGRLFESNSLACGKNGPGMDSCEQFPKTS